MKTYKNGNIIIKREMTENRFYDRVTGYRINENGEPIAFLGKYTTPSNYTEKDLFDLFGKGVR